MGFLLVVCIIIFVLCIIGMVANAKEKKEVRASGNCTECHLVPADKKWTEGARERYVCEKCYWKLVQARSDREKALKEREIAEKPVVVNAIPGTCSRDLYGKFIGGLPDSAGGWDVQLTVTNRTDKTVKYVFVELIPINTVGDVGYSPTVGAGAKPVRITGPLGPYGRLKDQVVKKFWYDIPIARVDVGKVEVVFMDGTEKSFKQ